MPYPTAHRSIVASGTMAGGEVWSCTLRAGGTFASTTQAMVDAIGEAWRVLITTSSSGFSNSTTLGSVRVYGVNTSGPADGPLSAVITGTAAGPGSNSLPNQCAVVVSLLAINPSARRRGRIYLPITANQVTSTGRLSTAQVTSIATNVQTMLNSINTALSPTGRLAIESTLVASTDTAIVSIRVGDVIDTQRRRRDALTENYVVRPVAAP